MSDQSLVDLLVANAAKDAERHVKQQKFLEAEIKTLINAIRTAPDLECLRAVANDSVERMRKHSLEGTNAGLREI
jgi:mRNA-degrading endonuclease YafQ of YafQ-DinJ toxin-antitoxin module